MQQLALFGAPERVFVDDETGKIVYFPGVLAAGESKRLFQHFSQSLTWTGGTMWMYDRTVTVPRLIARFAGDGLPGEVVAARNHIEEYLKARFNSISLQYYRDANDSVAWHSDRTEDLVDNAIVAVLSLGGAREMNVRSKARPRRAFSCALEPGSLFVMAAVRKIFGSTTFQSCGSGSRPGSASLSARSNRVALPGPRFDKPLHFKYGKRGEQVRRACSASCAELVQGGFTGFQDI